MCRVLWIMSGHIARNTVADCLIGAGAKALAVLRPAGRGPQGRPKGGLSNLKRSRNHAIPTEVLRPRRDPAKPRPAKPRAIIAQVEGSGAAAIGLLPPNQS